MLLVNFTVAVLWVAAVLAIRIRPAELQAPFSSKPTYQYTNPTIQAFFLHHYLQYE